MAYIFTEILIISWHPEIFKSFCEKTRAIKLKIQETHRTLTSLLMFSPEFILERELCNTSDFLSSHT